MMVTSLAGLFRKKVAPEWLIALVIWFISSTGYFTSVLARAKSDRSGQKKMFAFCNYTCKSCAFVCVSEKLDLI